ncbi:MAG: Clp protease ClpP [Candidatus Cloacimonetes bacterium]|jgi:ATP-dependent protease ClpP protease subunit|nr:Clp protease ClpP [Candidatus Cloacimonadota bacterium]
MTERRRFKTDDIDKFFDYGISLPSRTIYLGSGSYDSEGNESGVDGFLTERTIKSLHLLDNADSQADAGNKPITIIMNSIGGDQNHGMGIYDAIRSCKNFIEIKVYGYAMSMGSLILQAGDKRLMAENSSMMIHYGQSGYFGHAPTSHKWDEESKKLDKWSENVYLQRIRASKGNHNFPLKKLREWMMTDTFFNAEEAIGWGLADEIIKRYESPKLQ